MTKINEIHSTINYLEDCSRQTGKTTALINAAKSVENGVIVTGNVEIAYRIKRDHGVEACSISQLDTLKGRNCSLFYDNTAIMQLASRAVVENQKLEEENIKNENIKNENKKTKMNLYKINVNAISCIKESFDEVCNELKDKDFISDDEYHNVKVILKSFLDTYESVHYNEPRFISFKASDYNYDQMDFRRATKLTQDAVNSVKNHLIGTDIATGESCPKIVSRPTISSVKEETKSEYYQPNWNVSELKLPTKPLRGEAVNLAIIDEVQDISKTETGSHCQKCNYFNEYVSEDNYVCYSCKH